MDRNQLSETEILNLLLGTRRLDIALNDEQERENAQYARTHARRYLRSYELLADRLGPRPMVFSVGSMPNHLELLLVHYCQAEVVGSTFRGDDHRDGFVARYELPSQERYDIKTLLRDFTTEPLPLADGSCDCVLGFEVVEHLLESPAPLLAEIRRVLRPGGLLALSTPNAQYWHRLVYLANGLCYPDVSFAENVESRHHHLFTARELQEWVRAAGFEVVHQSFADVWDQIRNLVPLDLEEPFNHALVSHLQTREEFRSDNLFLLAEPSLAAVGIDFLDGWHGEETSGLSSWRWCADRGRIRVAVAHPGAFVLEGAIQSAMHGNEVETIVDGQLACVLPIKTGHFHPFELNLELPAGEHTLELASRAPATQLPPDRRPLTFAVMDLRLRPHLP